jgi:uncharacterized membrane protein YbhN (UPF0104 family)
MARAFDVEQIATRRSLLYLVVGILLVVGVTLLLVRAAGFAKVVEVLEEAKPVWLVVCFGAVALEYVGYVLAFRGTAEIAGGPKFGVWTSTVIVFASLGATRLIAAAGLGGLALNYWALRKAGADRHGAVVRVLGLNTLLYGFFGVIALVASCFLLVGLGENVPLGLTLGWIAFVSVCLLAGHWVTRPGRVERLSQPASQRWLARGFADAVQGVVLVRRLTTERIGVYAIAGAALYWVGDIACLWASLRAFDASASLPGIVIAYCTGYAANLLPLPTGGVGGVDAAMTLALTLVGVPLASALLAVVAYRLFSFWLTTIPGAAALVVLPRLGRELSRNASLAEPPAGSPATP